MPLAPNTQLDRYEILSQLNAGGMGEVYLAQDTKLNRKVALNPFEIRLTLFHCSKKCSKYLHSLKSKEEHEKA